MKNKYYNGLTEEDVKNQKWANIEHEDFQIVEEAIGAEIELPSTYWSGIHAVPGTELYMMVPVRLRFG